MFQFVCIFNSNFIYVNFYVWKISKHCNFYMTTVCDDYHSVHFINLNLLPLLYLTFQQSFFLSVLYCTELVQIYVAIPGCEMNESLPISEWMQVYQVRLKKKLPDITTMLIFLAWKTVSPLAQIFHSSYLNQLNVSQSYLGSSDHVK